MFEKLPLLILGLVFCLGSGCAVNPITGEEELMLFGEEQDIAIGRKYAPELEKQLGGRIADESLQDYMDRVGQKIARISHKPDWEYQFVALDHESVNAFALPGGHIFITRGMLEKLQTEAQLAAILAHETVHVVARDTSNAMSKQIGMGLLLSAATSGTSSRGVLTAADVTRQIISLQYSRKDEREADLGGLEYMVAAGYNPHGIVETMQMLQDQQKDKPIEFLSTHPSPENRIGYLTQKIREKYDGAVELKVGRETYSTTVLERLKSVQIGTDPSS